MTEAIWAVIMAGGSGTRFWPASRVSLPKQFLRLDGESSLLQATWARLDGLVAPERILVVCGEHHAGLVQTELPELSQANLILESVGRNTLPCLSLAQKVLRERAPDAIQIVLPADHMIPSREKFQASLKVAIEAARVGGLVTLGIPANSPATEYGYIEPGSAIAGQQGEEIWEVRRFIEKPDAQRAQELLAKGEHYWNSGIFVWSGHSFESALERHAQELWHGIRDNDGANLAAWMRELTPLSVDVGILEHATGCKVVHAGFHWSDVGSWPALADVLPDAGAGNRQSGAGQMVVHDASNNIVHGPDGHLTALLGVHDLVVVHTQGASLVCPKDRAQDVRQIVEHVREQAPDCV